MKINDAPFALLQIFRKVHNQNLIIQCNPNINPRKHLKLYQDDKLEFYAGVVAFDMFTKPDPNSPQQDLLKWQLLETYRIINTTIASELVAEAVKSEFLPLKTELEKTPYLKNLLTKIDKGELSPLLVCSGHGYWSLEDGFIDLKSTDTTVMTISLPGGLVADELATDLENDLYSPSNVAIVPCSDGTKPTKDIDHYPRFFSKKANASVPNYRLVQIVDEFPTPRVIEPLTGRVLLTLKDSKASGVKQDYLLLSTIIQQFKGRTFGWGACTGGNDEKGNELGQFQGYLWTTKDDVELARKKKNALSVSSSNTGQSQSSNSYQP